MPRSCCASSWGSLDKSTQDFLIAAVDAAAARWQDEDQGIWEIRGPARRYLHSALMSWVALDRGIALADLIGADTQVERWTCVRDDIPDCNSHAGLERRHRRLHSSFRRL
jgi:GH15 family glucan-1,4-alpha-glucosidase